MRIRNVFGVVSASVEPCCVWPIGLAVRDCTETGGRTAWLTPRQARRLAAELLRLADKCEGKKGKKR